MSGKTKRKSGARTLKARDPFWRLRRLLGEKKKASAKAYRRAASKKAEREARHDVD